MHINTHTNTNTPPKSQISSNQILILSPMLTSQGLVVATATAMAVSAGTVILFDLFRQNVLPPAAQIDQNPPPPVLKSCLSSGSGKSKKRVKFAEDVRDSKGDGELYRKGYRKTGEIQRKSCGSEVPKMPPNRAALYSGILRDRVHRVQCSY